MDDDRREQLHDNYRRAYEDALSELFEAARSLSDDYAPAIEPLIGNVEANAAFLEYFEEVDAEKDIADILKPNGLAYVDGELVAVESE